MLDQCFKLLKALNSDAKPWQIAWGLNLGLVLGLLPFYTPSAIFILFLICVLRINVASCLLAFSFFKGFAWLADQLILQLGEASLHANALQGLFSRWYQSDVLLFLQFNHTQVMGGWLLAFIILPFSITASYLLIVTYREQFLVWLKSTPVMKYLSMNKWYQRAMKANDIAAEFKSA